MCNCYIFACVSTSGKSCSCFKPFPVESQYEGEWLIEGYNKRRSIVQSKFFENVIYLLLFICSDMEGCVDNVPPPLYF